MGNFINPLNEDLNLERIGLRKTGDFDTSLEKLCKQDLTKIAKKQNEIQVQFWKNFNF